MFIDCYKIIDDIDELGNNIIGTTVNISSYTTTAYVVPSDGYVQLAATSTTTTRIRAVLYGADASNSISISAAYTLGNTFNSIFVRKGMRIKITDNTNNGLVYFAPLL